MGSRTNQSYLRCAQDRLITIDLLNRQLHSYKKDALQKEIPISAVAGVSTSDSSKALDMTVTFKGKEEPWSVRCRCAEQFETLAVVLRRIVAAAASDFSDEALNLIMDDASSPPRYATLCASRPARLIPCFPFPCVTSPCSSSVIHAPCGHAL